MRRYNREASSISKLLIAIAGTAGAIFMGFYVVDYIKKDNFALRRVENDQNAMCDEMVKLIALQKTLVNTTKKELIELNRVGLHHDTKAVVDAQYRLAAATTTLARLEHMLNCLGKGMAKDEAERIANIMVLDKEVVVTYKKEIEEYVQRGFAENDPKIQLARNKMAQKMAEIQRFEEKIG